MALLATKLYAPTLRAGLVPRSRLIERLTAGLACRLTLVSAPAGFGKTTLIAAWLHNASRAHSWLSLDEADNDPARFIAYLLAALQKIDPHIGQATHTLMKAPQPPSPEALLTGLLNDIAATPEPFVLVLDDYHLIQTLPIHQQISFLLEHQPPQMHLAIASREDPPLPLSRLRARGQVTEIRQADLRFTEEEAVDFLQRFLGLDISAADVAALHQHTEGWIAGLQLAALSMQGSDDIQRFVQTFTGSHRYVLDYLLEEVFRQQRASVQDFLVKTSILDRLAASLCDAVTQRTDSRDLLLALEQANLFLIPLDESRQWYRYHRLFRDLLRTQGAGQDAAALHLSAARWFAQAGFLDEAMNHALAAQDWDEAERLIEPASAQAINQGQFATLNRWLDALPEARLRSSPELAALKGWALLSLGQFAAVAIWADLADELLAPDAASFSQALVACLKIYVAQFRADIPQVIELAYQALTLLEGSDPYGLRGAALANLASAQVVMADIPAATQTYRELARLGQEAGHPISAVSALSSLGWLLHLQGDPREALALCQQALDLCVDPRGETLPLAGQALLGLGMIDYDLNELPRAREHLVRGLELGKQLGPTSGAMQAAFTLARIQHMMGEQEAALATGRGVRQTASQFNMPQIDAFVAACEADLDLRKGNIDAVAHWAEQAGLSPGDPPSFLREPEHLTYTRLLLHQNRLEEAQTLLASLESFAREAGLRRSLITVHILQALAQQARGQRESALACLEKAVRLAAPEGYRRVFLDEGPAVLALLPGVHPVAPDFVDSLLGGAPAELGQKTLASRRQPLVEPLSERELEVLGLMAAGLSNREIAERLFVSVGTVKTHVHNICGKLGARSRTQAAAQARELGLL